MNFIKVSPPPPPPCPLITILLFIHLFLPLPLPPVITPTLIPHPPHCLYGAPVRIIILRPPFLPLPSQPPPFRLPGGVCCPLQQVSRMPSGGLWAGLPGNVKKMPQTCFSGCWKCLKNVPRAFFRRPRAAPPEDTFFEQLCSQGLMLLLERAKKFGMTPWGNWWERYIPLVQHFSSC